MKARMSPRRDAKFQDISANYPEEPARKGRRWKTLVAPRQHRPRVACPALVLDDVLVEDLAVSDARPRGRTRRFPRHSTAA